MKRLLPPIMLWLLKYRSILSMVPAYRFLATLQVLIKLNFFSFLLPPPKVGDWARMKLNTVI